MSYNSLKSDLVDLEIESTGDQAPDIGEEIEIDSEKNVFIFGKDLNITKSQLVTIILLSSSFILTSAYYSLMAPFFPGEALKKEISQTHVGFIFGVFQFVLLVLSPFFGKYLQVFGIRYLFLSGSFLSSGSGILFGFLDMCPSGIVFFILCMACRIVSGIGASMALSYAIVGYYFPNNISTIVGLLEVCNGFGLMVGPVLGGFLYEIGGFGLPFFVLGGLLFVQFILAFIFFPDTKESNSNQEQSLPILPMLKKPSFFLTLQMLFVGSLSIGFMEPSIQLHLLPLNLSPVQLGAILLFPSFLYILTAPIVGYVCDKYKHSMRWFMFISSLISATSYSFFGPIPLLNLPLKLWIFLSSFIVYGFSIGGLTIPVYSDLTRIAIESGYSNDLRLQGLISGFFNSVWSLGCLLGPVMGGYVADLIGFNLASFLIVLMFLYSALVYALFYSISFCLKPTVQHVKDYDTNEPSETRPLIT